MMQTWPHRAESHMLMTPLFWPLQQTLRLHRLRSLVRPLAPPKPLLL
ncbi:hypothetical protein H5410_021365 [Solanum commersonii]|uniref:Uncharacterized protein n=1 Tax=Solanum commersonii TaxID=4109 RepID=A0A9J5ZEY0_SOLCO|nr:hypothetical protein H5410_021365 [Solanum commersonii]